MVESKGQAFYEESQSHHRYLYGLADTHMARLLEVEARVVAGEAGARQVQASVQEVLASRQAAAVPGVAAPAPASAAGPFCAGAGLQQPPGMPTQDPWQQALDGNARSRNAAAPSAGGAQPAAFSIHTPPRQGRGVTPTAAREVNFFTNLFDKKEAKELPRYDGKAGGALWRKKVSNYLVSKCPEIRPLLKLAEQEREPITGRSLASYSTDSTSMITIEPSLSSYHLWGFLNVNLQDRACEILKNCEPVEIPEEEVSGADSCNGLEVWRRVLIDVAQTTLADRLRLEDVVLSPPVCKDEYAVPAALGS